MAFSVGMLRDTAELISEGSGSRSPLNSRFTVKAGGPALKPAPAVGPAPKNGMRLTKNRASEVAPKAPVIRTNNCCLAIELLHGAKPIKQTTDQTRQKPPRQTTPLIQRGSASAGSAPRAQSPSRDEIKSLGSIFSFSKQ